VFLCINLISNILFQKLHLLTLLFSLFFGFSLYAQQLGSVSGKVIELQSNEPVPFATVSIKGITDSTFFTGSLTGSEGTFNITKLPFGNYKLSVTFIGYKNYEETFVLNSVNEIFKANVKLEVASEILEEFEISAERSDMVIAIDRKVFNVAENPILQGGNALDALRQVPTLVVDAEGGVSLRGSSNIAIFINGRPSGINAENLSLVLEGMPANSIENVEVITNPSAKYDADGMAGIINIVTKKNIKPGKSSTFNVGVGNRNKYALGGSHSFRNKKLSGIVNLNTQYQEFFRNASATRNNFFEGQPANSLATNRDGINGRLNLNLSGNLAYDFTDNSNLALTYNVGANERWERDTISYLFYEGSDVLTNQRYREGREDQNSFNGDFGLTYTQNFSQDKKQKNELVIGQNLSIYNREDLQAYVEQNSPIRNGYVVNPLRENALRTRNNMVSITQADYVKDFNNFKFETGAKLNYRNLRNAFDVDSLNNATGNFDNNALLTNRFDYLEYVTAGYLNFSGTFAGFGFQAGLRAENTAIEINQPETNQNFERNYFNFFPSAFINKKFKNDLELQLNYTRRINRPGPWALNPFPDLTDPLNIRTGNPFLDAEFINSYEFSTVKYWKNQTVTFSVYHREISNSIQRFTIVDEQTGIANQTRLNIGSAQNTGFELISRNSITKWFDNTVNLNLFRNYINGGSSANNLTTDAINWDIRNMASIKLPGGFDLQFTFFFLAPVNTPQGRWVGYYHLDAGIKKEILNKRGMLVLNVMDVFDWREYQITSSDFNFTETRNYKRESQYFMLNFTYRFGDYAKEKDDKTKGSGSDDFGF